AGLLVVNQCADRDLQDQIVAGVAGAVGAFAVTSAVGAKFTIVAIAQQRVVVRIRLNKNAAAVSAIAAGRPASGHVLLAAEGDAAVPAIAGLYEDFGFIDKHVRVLIESVPKWE